MTLKEAVEFATTRLSAVSDSATLDAQLLICHACNINHTKLISYPEQQFSVQQRTLFDSSLERRSKGEPLAYIVGSKEFWSLDFMVNSDVLIPRPETELLVELTLNVIAELKTPRVLDLGTGSGAIAISIYKERNDCELIATDNSLEAINVARENAKHHNAKINFIQSNWYESLSEINFNVIVCNPPYIEKDDPLLDKYVARYEPKQALISGDNGLKDLQAVIAGAKQHLHSNGYLIVEHGFQQASDVKNLFSEQDFNDIASYKDLAERERCTLGLAPENIALDS